MGSSGHSGKDGRGNPNPDSNPPSNPNPALNSTSGGPSSGNLGNLSGNPEGDSRDSGSGSGASSIGWEKFLKVITTITHTIHSIPSKPCAKPKAKESDIFDESDSWKLVAFILKCKLYFQNFLKKYEEDDKKINFALSYFKG